jgi:GNAT superfamily N-acetyltransferase
MADWLIERLNKSHDRTEFCCGKPPLDDFLRTLVSQYEKRHLGRTNVAVRQGEKRVCGYYTLTAGAISFQNLPPKTARKLPRHPVPVILLARLAVDQKAQAQGLGRALLVNALERCLDVAEKLGVRAFEVDAIDPQAAEFYQKHGFVPLLDSPLHLSLPITSIRKAAGDE